MVDEDGMACGHVDLRPMASVPKGFECLGAEVAVMVCASQNGPPSKKLLTGREGGQYRVRADIYLYIASWYWHWQGAQALAGGFSIIRGTSS